MSEIVFGNPKNPITADKSIIHDNESFSVQWTARNDTAENIDPFRDHLVITSIPEGCPGSDDNDHPVVFDSADRDAADYTEDALPAGATGPLMQPSVGPFPAGSYRLTVTLDVDLGRGDTTFDCINIVEAD